jgi:flagellin-like hook-associated protein FlgL
MELKFFFEKTGTSLSTKEPLDDTPFENMKKFQQEPEGEYELAGSSFNPLDRGPASKNAPEGEVPKTQTGDRPSNPMDKRSAIYNAVAERQSVFDHLKTLENALLTDNEIIIQELLERLDEDFERAVQMRTRIGALYNSVINSEENISKQKIMNETYKTKIEDADVADLFSNIAKQNNILQATYKASSATINRTLLDFIR